jgi:hypothetical protein
MATNNWIIITTNMYIYMCKQYEKVVTKPVIIIDNWYVIIVIICMKIV